MSIPSRTRAAEAFRTAPAASLPGLLALLCACATASPQPAPIADLAGTDWQVAAVNGRATPAQGDYSMRFHANGGIGARFGCNSMGGSYQVVGGTLVVTNLTQTLMGCPEPAATFEREGSAILGQPMQVSFASDERMGLSNAAGSIGLVPIVPVTAADLQGTWNVTSINGVATPGGRTFQVAFSGDRLSGRFGCNTYRAVFVFENGRFRPIGGSWTEIGCDFALPDAPAVSVMQLEEWAFAVLRSGPKAQLGPDGTLSLVGGGGSIELRRAP